MLLVVGANDDEEGFRAPAEELRQALSRRSPAHTSVAMPGMGHPLTEEPGLEPVPQTDHAAHVYAVVVDWLRRYHERTDIEELET